MKINYYLNEGHWNPKDEVKVAFYSDLYAFVQSVDKDVLRDILLSEFILLEPYIIGNLAGKYFLKEIVGGKLTDQPQTYFVGFCYHQQKYLKLWPHLIAFFAAWRDIERCSEPNATDFFASSWASLVDTAKFFKYTTVDELKRGPEAPSVQCDIILHFLQNCPDTYDAPDDIVNGEAWKIPTPRKENYAFLGWFASNEFKGERIDSLVGASGQEVNLYAKWETYTLFHSNDGYAHFDMIYDDFLADFSNYIGMPVSKEAKREEGHGIVSHFCQVSEGRLHGFFAQPKYYQKWLWLLIYFQKLYDNNVAQIAKFAMVNDQFGDEAQVRWELNSLFVGRFHVVHPKTKDYSGSGVKEKLADSTNQEIIKIKYIVGDTVLFPKVNQEGHILVGWYQDYRGHIGPVDAITNDQFAGKTLFAKWKKA